MLALQSKDKVGLGVQMKQSEVQPTFCGVARMAQSAVADEVIE
jgi:hypothetical protein